jgi:hypothetical protein
MLRAGCQGDDGLACGELAEEAVNDERWESGQRACELAAGFACDPQDRDVMALLRGLEGRVKIGITKADASPARNGL